MTESKTRYSLWLTGGTWTAISRVVTSLSEKLKVKPLHPHVTLFSVAGNQEYAAQLADRCAAAAKPLSCPVGAVDVSDTEHMCVFAHVTKTDELKKLRSLVSDRDYVPHVSLVYGKLDAISMDQRKALAASIALPKDTVLDMNTIEVWDTTSGDYSQWTRVYSVSLGGEAKSDSLEQHHAFIRRSIELAAEAVKAGNHPFGALLVVDGKEVVSAQNTVNKPVFDVTRHAELNLVSKACQALTQQQLSRAILYTSTEPCPMCSGALYWAGIPTVVFCCSHECLDKHAGRSLQGCKIVLGPTAFRATKVIGPVLESEGEPLHASYWKNLGAH